MSAIDLWVPFGDGNIVNTLTGETFDLERVEWHKLARVRKAIVDIRPVLDDTARVLDTEIARRLDASNDRHILVDGIELRVNRPQSTEWDVERLRANLEQLVSEGRLAAGVVPRALKREVTYKPVASELTKLLDSADPRIAELVRECRSVVPARRRVQVIGG